MSTREMYIDDLHDIIEYLLDIAWEEHYRECPMGPVECETCEELVKIREDFRDSK